MNYESFFKNKSVLIIGGTGTVGINTLRRLLEFDVKVVRVFSRDEHKQFFLRHMFDKEKRVRFLIGDIRDKERLIMAMEGIDIVYHFAAMKHVPACEYNPFEAVRTNVVGTQNVVSAALNWNVERVIYTSTDKAANPINTMGATKLLAEKLISAANYYKGNRKTVFASTRFGNILGSRGSVLLLFDYQMRNSRPITVTDPYMTRFVMDVDDAIDLIFKTTISAIGGETFVFKMPVVRIGDLVEEYLKITGKETEVKLIGPRPGEKSYEELMSEEESLRAVETEDMFIILPYSMHPSVDGKYAKFKRAGVGSYTSNDYPPLSKEKINEVLKKSLSRMVDFDVLE